MASLSSGFSKFFQKNFVPLRSPFPLPRSRRKNLTQSRRETRRNGGESNNCPPRKRRGEKKITVPLDKGERARKLCPAKRRGKGVPAAPQKKSPAMFFGRRPPSNQRRATPYVPAITPNSLSEGLREPSAGHRPASPPKKILTLFQGCKPCGLQHGATPREPSNPHRHACKAVRVPASLASPANQNNRTTVPLDKGERARKLCSAKRSGKGVPAAFPPRPQKIPSHCSKAVSLADYSTGQRPVNTPAHTDMPVRLSESRLPALRPRIKN